MKYFFDNCISPKYAAMLRALEVDVQALRDIFPQDVKDIDLLAKIPKRLGKDVIFVTGDTHISRRKAEAQALRESKLTALFLGPFWSNMQFWDQAIWLVRRWPSIDNFASSVERGTFAEIKQRGKAAPFVL